MNYSSTVHCTEKLSRTFLPGISRSIYPFFFYVTEPMYWVGSVKTLIWWRNQVVAPLSEEWTFRACMLPLLLQCFNPTTAIFICPLFFGVAHFHHLVERTRRGMDFKLALSVSCEFFFRIYKNSQAFQSPDCGKKKFWRQRGINFFSNIENFNFNYYKSEHFTNKIIF